MRSHIFVAAAAGVIAAGSAHAADLAKKAPAAANYVKVCDAYGAGYFYIPGSDTCLKIYGYARYSLAINGPSKDWLATHSAASSWTRSGNGLGTTVKVMLGIDARTTTEFGLLRSNIETQVDNVTYNLANGTNFYVDKAFVQFAGLTAGRSQSFFDFLTIPQFTLSSTNEPISDVRVNLLAYTYSFGNGITATLSIEDPSTSANPNSAAAFAGNRRWGYASTQQTHFYTGTDVYGGVHVPDVVGSLAISQAWGSAQLSAVVHQDAPSSDADAKVGWAVQGGVKLNLPMLAEGDVLGLQAAYAKGAVGYVADGFTGNATSFSVRDFFLDTGKVDQSAAYTFYGAFVHNWTKTIYTANSLAYTKYDAPSSRTANEDFSYIDARMTLGWKPVKNMLIATELDYGHVDYSRPTLKDADQVTGFLRFQRNF